MTMKYSKTFVFASLLLACIQNAYAWSMNPDGSYGPDDTTSYMAPNGTFQPGMGNTMNPDGSFSGTYDREENDSPVYMNPNRTYGRENDYLRPDGSYGSRNSELTPGGYVNRY